MRVFLGILLAGVLGTAALAQDDDDAPKIYDIGSDVFEAGSSIDQSQTGKADIFLFGETAVSTADITGGAHIFARRVTVEGAVGQDVYAAGQYVTVAGDVAGNVTTMAMNVDIEGNVAGNVRATGSEVVLQGDIGGYAMVFAETLTINGVVSGDLVFGGRTLDFGPDGEVTGKVTLHEEDPGDVHLPERLRDRGDVESVPLDEDSMPGASDVLPSTASVVLSFLGGVLTIAVIAALIAGFMPDSMAKMRRAIVNQPGRAFIRGFIAESTIIGGGVLLVMTLIGILLLPAVIVLAFLAAFLGHVVGAYALGVRLLAFAGKGEPADFKDRALSAFVGALIAGLIFAIPFVGWLFYMALFLVGIGGIIAWLFPGKTRRHG
ncbi:polymer-forming cytoskeletal protein [Chachezhania antarctica]|uniref:polymer-forming cytoskeletal protein n=1 Tax=Chachezhania antarctica TaxID=2340860 RepID=UPI0013CEA6BB|nr:polymer-forming cytoskeletal protein [Chachezhania antarctica]